MVALSSQKLRTERVVWSFFFQAEDGIRDDLVTGVQTCALPISEGHPARTPEPSPGRRPEGGAQLGVDRMRRPGRPWAAVQSCRPGVERISRIEGAASVMVIDAASLTTAAASHTTASATHTKADGAGGTTPAPGTG